MPNLSQAENKSVPKYPGLWGRICQALKTDKPSKIAAIMGLSVPSVSQWKVLHQVPSLDNLVTIAKLGNTSLEWLLFGARLAKWDRAIETTGEPWLDSSIRSLANENGKAFFAQANDLIAQGFIGLQSENVIKPGESAIYFTDAERSAIMRYAQEGDEEFVDAVRTLVIEELRHEGFLPEVKQQPEASNIIYFGEFTQMIELPLIGEIAAGGAMEPVQLDEKVSVPDIFRPRVGLRYMVLRVRGDSMIGDDIKDGSLIVCEVRHDAKNGEIVAALIDGQNATVKRLYREPNRIRLQPANPAHQPVYVEAHQKLEIQGVVVGIWRPS